MFLRRVLPLLAAAAVVACSSPRKTEGGGQQADSTLATCTSCHGDPANSNAAPPRAVQGDTETASVRVGAHQQHLQTNGIRLAIDCSECHVVPRNIADPGHIDKSTADLTWGPIASAGGFKPTYTRSADGTTATCTNYCHGGTFTTDNGSVHAPVWNKVDGSQAGCGTCHAIPPPAPHPPAPSLTNCAQCHPATVNSDGTLNISGGRHINGIIDLGVSGAGCEACHGDPQRLPADIAAAPPRDTKGNTASNAPGVGAHLAHLQGSAVRASLPCAACHTVPTDLSHVNGVLDLTWGPLSRTGGAVPTWNPASVTCTNYCHGLPAWGGSNTTPVWTGGSAQAACGTCHGIPPAPPHVPVNGDATACAGCHPGTVKADGTIDVAGGKHIDGTVEVTSGNCTVCHGDPTRTNAAVAAAPPKDTSGNTATTAPGVGAHQAHLNAGSLAAALGCGECHTVPTTLAHATAPLDLTWGPTAHADNVQPAFDSTAITCTNYCHGASMTGGSHTSPKWTAGSGEVTCGSCHAVPSPTGQHGLSQHAPFANSCASCHGSGYTLTTVSLPLHVNGTRDVFVGAPITSWNPANKTCTALCHTNQSEVRTW
jgi:predicted CxxxxCH...CXXCH cytochrome family protein